MNYPSPNQRAQVPCYNPLLFRAAMSAPSGPSAPQRTHVGKSKRVATHPAEATSQTRSRGERIREIKRAWQRLSHQRRLPSWCPSKLADFNPVGKLLRERKVKQRRNEARSGKAKRWFSPEEELVLASSELDSDPEPAAPAPRQSAERKEDAWIDPRLRCCSCDCEAGPSTPRLEREATVPEEPPATVVLFALPAQANTSRPIQAPIDFLTLGKVPSTTSDRKDSTQPEHMASKPHTSSTTRSYIHSAPSISPEPCCDPHEMPREDECSSHDNEASNASPMGDNGAEKIPGRPLHLPSRRRSATFDTNSNNTISSLCIPDASPTPFSALSPKLACRTAAAA